MTHVDRMEDWVGQSALDSEGERVGKLDEVFYSTASGHPVFAAVKSGLLGRHADVVPLAGATAGRDYVRLAYTAAQIEQAASDVDARDTIEYADAQHLAQIYGVEIAENDRFEGARVLGARNEAAAEARRAAEALEEQARQRAAEAHDANAEALDAEQTAVEKTELSDQARIEAKRAREDITRLPTT
jgi:hypothetical protein